MKIYEQLCVCVRLYATFTAPGIMVNVINYSLIITKFQKDLIIFNNMVISSI